MSASPLFESRDMLGIQAVIVLAKTVTLVCGGFVTVLAYRAYRRTGSSALWALMTGFGLVTTGALLAGGVHQVLGVGLDVGIGIQSTFTALGFAVLAYSLYAERGAPTP